MARIKNAFRNRYEKYLAFRGPPRHRNRVATCVVVIESGVEDRVDVIAAIRSPRSRSRRLYQPPLSSWRACSRVPRFSRPTPLLSVRNSRDKRPSVLRCFSFSSSSSSSSSSSARRRFCYARLLLVSWIRRSAASPSAKCFLLDRKDPLETSSRVLGPPSRAYHTFLTIIIRVSHLKRNLVTSSDHYVCRIFLWYLR